MLNIRLVKLLLGNCVIVFPNMEDIYESVISF